MYNPSSMLDQLVQRTDRGLLFRIKLAAAAFACHHRLLAYAPLTDCCIADFCCVEGAVEEVIRCGGLADIKMQRIRVRTL